MSFRQFLFFLFIPVIAPGQNGSTARVGVGIEFIKGYFNNDDPRLTYHSNILLNSRIGLGKSFGLKKLTLFGEVGFNKGGYRFKTLSIQNLPSAERKMDIYSFNLVSCLEKDMIKRNNQSFIKGLIGLNVNWNAIRRWEPDPNKTINGKNIVRTFDLGILGGISCNIYKRKRTEIVLDSRFYYGISDILPHSEREGFKRGIEVGVRYIFLSKNSKKKKK